MTQHPEEAVEAVDTPNLPDTCDGGRPYGIHLHTARCFHAGVRAGYAARVAEDTALDAPEVIERAAREAFWTDDVGGHHKPGSQPHTWENIPEIGRENYRALVRAVLRAALDAPTTSS